MIEATKEIMVNAIIGHGVVGYNEVHSRYADFTGNQHNPDWKFNRERLEEEALETLIDIYKELVARGKLRYRSDSSR